MFSLHDVAFWWYSTFSVCTTAKCSGNWFDGACVSRSAESGSVCVSVLRRCNIILKSHAGRLLQNIHTFTCDLYNIFSLSYDLMLSSICRSYTLHKKQYVVAQLHEIDVGWFIKKIGKLKYSNKLFLPSCYVPPSIRTNTSCKRCMHVKSPT